MSIYFFRSPRAVHGASLTSSSLTPLQIRKTARSVLTTAWQLFCSLSGAPFVHTVWKILVQARDSSRHVWTSELESKKSTDPRAHMSPKPVLDAPPGVRTLDTLIKSQVLYQLS